MTPRRAAIVAIGALALAACSTPDVVPTPVPSATPSPSAAPSFAIATVVPQEELAAAGAFSNAICPVFLDILELDLRLAAMRSDGTVPEEIVTDADEVAAVIVEVRAIVVDLDRLPSWTPGSQLRLELIRAFHEIRISLDAVEAGLDGPEAAALLAGIPYIASAQMDQAMVRAASGGLDCEGFG